MNDLEQETQQNLYTEYSKHVSPHSQAQFDTTMQLRLIIAAANKLGLYDGADAILKRFNL